MTEVHATVFIVDDDEASRDSLCLLMKSVGQTCRSFATAQAFLDAYEPGWFGVLVLDVRMPGMSGLELQQKLKELAAVLPVIFITGHGDVPMAVKAMQEGAVDFIQKPIRDQELLDRINHELEQISTKQREMEEWNDIQARLATLSAREQEVMERVVAGKSNKMIARELDISQRTVEIHRSHVMDKMGASSLAELIHMAMREK